MAKEVIERTLVIIKPDGLKKNVVGKIIARIEASGLTIKRIQTKKISSEDCKKLYSKTRKQLPEIYAAVEKHMIKNPSIILIVEGPAAIQKVRKIRGSTNLLETPVGTVRRDFVTDEERELFRQGRNVKNVMHAADDKEEAEFEINLLFDQEEE